VNVDLIRIIDTLEEFRPSIDPFLDKSTSIIKRQYWMHTNRQYNIFSFCFNASGHFKTQKACHTNLNSRSSTHVKFVNIFSKRCEMLMFLRFATVTILLLFITSLHIAKSRSLWLCVPLTTFPLMTFPLTTFPLTMFPLMMFPLTMYPLTMFPLTMFPLTTFTLTTFPLTTFPLKMFPLKTFPLTTFPLTTFL
jgi:hypothetical protein